MDFLHAEVTAISTKRIEKSGSGSSLSEHCDKAASASSLHVAIGFPELCAEATSVRTDLKGVENDVQEFLKISVLFLSLSSPPPPSQPLRLSFQEENYFGGLDEPVLT